MVTASLLGAAGCGAPDAAEEPAAAEPAGWTEALDGALDYLSSTEAAFGIDVAVLLQTVSELTGDPRPAAVAEQRRADIDPDELAAYGPLLAVQHPAFPDASFEGVAPSSTEPDPGMPAPVTVGGDSLVALCLQGAVECRLDGECRDFINAPDRWGYVLTHQAVWLQFWRWLDCGEADGVDLEARRRSFGANLAAEARFDPGWSDLGGERLSLLGHLGFAAALEPAWIESVLQAQQAPGCWRVGAERPCHPHPTALALWALAQGRRAGRWPG